MSVFGTLIKQARLVKRLSQRALAEQLGVNFTYLSKIESGEMPPPSEDLIEKLIEALELNPDVAFQAALKVPRELAQIALQPSMPVLMRAARDLSPEDLEYWAEKMREKP